nr:MAG TPA: hypothetical protein [Caudoviricetes sp.]
MFNSSYRVICKIGFLVVPVGTRHEELIVVYNRRVWLKNNVEIAT